LKQALLVNPGSERAMRGLEWAQAQLAKQAVRPAATSEPITRPLLSARSLSGSVAWRCRPKVRHAAHAQSGCKSGLAPLVDRKAALAAGPALDKMLCGVASLVAWPGSTSLALALIRSESGPGLVAGRDRQPSLTPMVTATLQPTQTPLPSPTPTFTAIPHRYRGAHGAADRRAPVSIFPLSGTTRPFGR